MNIETENEGKSVLIVAPYGRDAESVAVLLGREGLGGCICADLDEVAARLSDDTGMVLVTEEALAAPAQALVEALRKAPAWSDMPFVVLAAPTRIRGRSPDLIHRKLPPEITNLVVIERPTGSESLISAVTSALRGRRRQFEMRDRLGELAESEASLRQLNRTLEDRVSERTARLEAEMTSRASAEAALRQSQKMEAVGQLTGGIAHDFNNMLTGILGSIDILRRRMASGRLDKAERYLDVASESAQRAASLTARLLAFSRRQSLDSQPTDINELVAGLEGLLAQTVTESISLDLALEADLPLGRTDANQLESAILNLAINARDAMPEGGRLTVRTRLIHVGEAQSAGRPDLKSGAYIVVAVSDTGVGIEPALLDKVFEPFFTTKPIGQGTGLGLSMVYGFARQNGGIVRIHSRPGEGTSVAIYLPVSEASEAEAAAPAEVVAIGGHGETVLVVEDDAAVRLLVTEVLGELGYKTLQAAEPQSAIGILNSAEPIQLLISDVGLPGMNGRQLAEVAREGRPELPILFITGYAENAAIRSGFLGTNMAMITKPFALGALGAKISEMLN